MLRLKSIPIVCIACLLSAPVCAQVQTTRKTEVYKRIKAYLDSVPAIDTHDHLFPFDHLSGKTGQLAGRGVDLWALWQHSYCSWINPIARRESGQPFDEWWSAAKNDFDNARATTFYRFLLPAFADLYGINFDRITDHQARKLDRRINDNYRDQRWVYEVVTERANIELMLIDPFWDAIGMKNEYRFTVPVLNVGMLIHGHHRSRVKQPGNNLYAFAEKNGLEIKTLDDYLTALDMLMSRAKEKGIVCLKSAIAYLRTLQFAKIPRDRAEKAFGKRTSELSKRQIKDFEDFIVWRLVELSAKHDLPFQIHTGHARIQSSNPMLLVDMIEANKNTKFILFHGGYPWVDETGAIVQWSFLKKYNNVWIDSVWLPTISYSMGKQAFHYWLEMMPSNRIMWGADCLHVEGIYGATEITRRCLAEVLAEKVMHGDLLEEHALRIGKQILRDNALELFPGLKHRLWKHKIDKLTPAEP
ncbi:MAG: amidohydrolase family protein [Planctomycetota bacterium]|nr:MAG: amidohydrolase family protein [Planctomycetota bacterium]